MLLALPCGHDQFDLLQQSSNLAVGFISYLQEKQAAGIVNVPYPSSSQVSRLHQSHPGQSVGSVRWVGPSGRSVGPSVAPDRRDVGTSARAFNPIKRAYMFGRRR